MCILNSIIQPLMGSMIGLGTHPFNGLLIAFQLVGDDLGGMKIDDDLKNGTNFASKELNSSCSNVLSPIGYSDLSPSCQTTYGYLSELVMFGHPYEIATLQNLPLARNGYCATDPKKQATLTTDFFAANDKERRRYDFAGMLYAGPEDPSAGQDIHLACILGRIKIKALVDKVLPAKQKAQAGAEMSHQHDMFEKFPNLTQKDNLEETVEFWKGKLKELMKRLEQKSKVGAQKESGQVNGA